MDRAPFRTSLRVVLRRAGIQRVIIQSALSILCCGSTLIARAEGPTSSKVAAEALFDRGVALMKDGKYTEACTQLEQSQSIERGIGTMLYLGECYERLGRLASAWAMFREAASAARAEGQPERAEAGSARAAKLEPKLPKLTLQVAAGNTMPGFVLQLNGVSLQSSVWGVPMPVDPGDNRIEARAPGYLTFTHVQPVGSGEGASAIVTVPVLDPDPQAQARAADAPTPAAVAATADVGTSSDALASGNPRPWQRPLGLVVGGVGVVALGIGTYFGLHAISKDNSADKLCGNAAGDCGDSTGSKNSHDANNAAKLANGFLIGGAVLAAAGVVLYLTAPSDHAAALAFRGDARSLSMSFGGAL